MDRLTVTSERANRLVRRARPSVSEIVPELLVGEYLRCEDIAWLATAYRVTAVQSLQDNEDLRINGLDIRELRDRYELEGVRFLRTPISDAGAAAMSGHLEEALSALRSLVERDERVYLHCNAGINRAPTVAIAYLYAFRAMSLDDAQAHVKKRRACGPFMTVLEEYFDSRRRKPTE